MDDKQIHQHIDGLVSTEKELRGRLARGELSATDEQARLADVERQLDQLWDLLRQRQAREEFGTDPDGAKERSQGVVEGYLD